MSPSPGPGRHQPPSGSSSNTLRSSLYDIDGETTERNTLVGRKLRNGHQRASLGRASGMDRGSDEAQQQELDNRRKRPRKTGGFLLNNSFATPRISSRAQPVSQSLHSTPESIKGKGRAALHNGNGTAHTGVHRLKREATNGSISRDRSPFDRNSGHSGSHGSLSESAPRISLDGSNGSSVQPGDADDMSFSRGSEEWQHRNVSESSVDPTQIVQMALSLSEGRRRHASGAYLTPPPASAAARRAASAGLTAGAPMLSGTYNTGGSLKKYLNEQRRISRNMSPTFGKSSNAARHASNAYGLLGAHDTVVGQNRYVFSDATRARAEKAQEYLESRAQFIKLLEILPPLKPDSAWSGNNLHQTTSLMGGAVEFSRLTSNMSKTQELGRPFNPIQTIRNRKLRARMRKPCNPDAEYWKDPAATADWINAVEEIASYPEYRQEDRVHLPQYLEGLDRKDDDTPFSPSYSRTESTKLKRARSDWQVPPEELFADAYWLEQSDNKRYIVDRNEYRLFPNMAAAAPDSASLRHNDRTEELMSRLPTISSGKGSVVPGSAETSDFDNAEDEVRGRLHSTNRDQSPSKLRQIWHKTRQRSPASSDLDVSDEGSDVRGRKRRNERNDAKHESNDTSQQDDLAIGNQQRGYIGDSNASYNKMPTTPDRKPVLLTEHDQDSASPRASGGGRRRHLRPMPKPMRDQVDGSQSERNSVGYAPLTLDTSYQQRSSLDNSSVPDSPMVGDRLAPPLRINDSPNRSRASSVSRLGIASKIPFYGRHKEEKKTSLQSYGIEDSDHNSSRHGSGEMTDGPAMFNHETHKDTSSRVHQLTHPHLFKHKSNVSLSNTGDLSSTKDKKDNRDDKDTVSAVTRFFKGSRIGSRARNGTINSDAAWDKTQLSDHHEISSSRSSSVSRSSRQSTDDDQARYRGNYSGNLTKTSTSTSQSQMNDRKAREPHYYTSNLPAFKSAYHSSQSVLPASEKSKSSRSDLLRRLRTDTNNMSRTTSRNTSNISEAGSNNRRGSYGFPSAREASRLQRHPSSNITNTLGAPGSVGRTTLPVTGLASLQGIRTNSRSPLRRPSVADARSWSISDTNISRTRSHSKQRASSQAARPRHTSALVVNRLDIERVHALLMCTGIKAETITRRSQEVRTSEDADASLRSALKFTGHKHIPVQRKEEHVLAARILAESYEASVSALRRSAEVFTTETTSALIEQLEKLKAVAGDDLMDTSLRLQDEAARVASDITTKGTREVQAVNEAVQMLQRTRRRRLRWMRRLGWGMLEWLLLGVMWWVWLVVMVVRSCLRVFLTVGAILRWLFFL